MRYQIVFGIAKIRWRSGTIYRHGWMFSRDNLESYLYCTCENAREASLVIDPFMKIAATFPQGSSKRILDLIFQSIGVSDKLPHFNHNSPGHCKETWIAKAISWPATVLSKPPLEANSSSTQTTNGVPEDCRVCKKWISKVKCSQICLVAPRSNRIIWR